MGTPVSKLTKPNPHQYLTGLELLRRVEAIDPVKTYAEEISFYIGARCSGKYDIGGTFKWSKQPDNSKPKKGNWLTGQEYETKYVLTYQRRGKESWRHDAESVLVMVFKLSNSGQKEIAHWNQNLQQWILSEWMED